jgi:hypothetical protein
MWATEKLALISRKIGSLRKGWNWLLTKPERLTALSTLAIFLATAVAAGVGFVQWRTLRSTDEAIRIQAGIMKGQLDEMQIARQPFVVFQDVEFHSDPNSSKDEVTIFAYPQWLNTGDNPTSRLRYSVFCNTSYSKEFNYQINGTVQRILGPKQTDGGGRCEMHITDIPNNAGVIGLIYIGGKATYYNDSRDPKIRITEFCRAVPIVRTNTANGFGIRAGMDGMSICSALEGITALIPNAPPKIARNRGLLRV